MPNKETRIKELEEICERYELATSAANIGVYDWVISTGVVYYSAIWKSQIGYKEHELENNFETWISLLHPDESEKVQKKAKNYLENPEGQYVNEFRFRHKNGTYIWILAKAEAIKDDNGNVIRLLGSHTDITEKKEVALKLKAIYNQSSEGITIADVDGKYVFVNPAFCDMSGYSEKELLKLTVFDMKGENQDHSSFDKTKESPQIMRVVLKKKNGSEYYSEIVGDVIYINNEKLILGTIRDVSDRVIAEKKVAEVNDNLELLVEERTIALNETVAKLNHEIELRIVAEKKIQDSLSIKETLLREITHRVKNNFQIILSLISLQKSGIDDPKFLDLLGQTSHRIQTMALIHETLYKTNTFDDVVFKSYIKSLLEYIRTISDDKNVQILEEVCDNIIPINEATNFGMIIMELITNSLKHAFPNDQKGVILLKMEFVDGEYKLTVNDNGVGVPKDFDFRNTESLGMQVVISLTEQLEGTINLLDNEGTTFEIVV